MTKQSLQELRDKVAAGEVHFDHVEASVDTLYAYLKRPLEALIERVE